MIKSLYKKLSLRYLRTSLRGYRLLKQSGAFKKIPKLIDKLALTPLDLRNTHGSFMFFGEASKQVELATRQFLCIRILFFKLPQAIYYSQAASSKEIIYPLPAQWQKIIEGEGYKVNRVKSTFLWWGFILLLWLYGNKIIVETIGHGLINCITRKRNIPERDYVHFEQLSNINLPSEPNNEETFDIINWYLSSRLRQQNISNITYRSGTNSMMHRGVKILPKNKVEPNLATWAELTKFIVWSCKVSILSFFHLCIGKWQSPLMLNQAVLVKVFQLVPKSTLAKQYLFNNSGMTYRPLWTYEVEKYDTQIIMYFYSTNIEGFKNEGAVTPENSIVKLMNWPHYFLWNQEQKKFLQTVLDYKFDYDMTGSIWFSDCLEKLPDTETKSVAIFDVQPHRLSKYFKLGLGFDYYVPSIAAKFIEDNLTIGRQMGYKIYWKKKREIGKDGHPYFVNKTKTLIKNEEIVQVPPCISAHRLIKRSSIVVSMPYTSTALIARDMGIPSCYYDASGLLQINDPGAHGIPMLQNPSELKVWLASIM